MDLHQKDILTKITRFNLIRNGRMIYIDVHEKIQGNLADLFIAVPNLVNIVAKPEHQGSGKDEKSALADCLKKIKGLNIEDLFPAVTPISSLGKEN
jgi:alpha-N-acetylglucosamine transferase